MPLALYVCRNSCMRRLLLADCSLCKKTSLTWAFFSSKCPGYVSREDYRVSFRMLKLSFVHPRKDCAVKVEVFFYKEITCWERMGTSLECEERIMLISAYQLCPLDSLHAASIIL